MEYDSNLTRSMVEPIVLRLVAERPWYGYELIKVVNERTGGAFEWKEGTLRSSSGDKVTNQKQAIAIALSEQRRANRRRRG